MRNPLVIANWKMHGSQQFIEQWLQAFTIDNIPVGVEVVVCPPNPYLSLFAERCQTTSLALGAQNLNEYESGAFTGEVSASMLVECGCTYTIIGHSERRTLFCDTDTRVASKVQSAMQCGIIPVLCVGESLEQRSAGETKEVLRNQILSALQGIESIDERLVLAYEPLWAIGSGQSATSAEVEEVGHFIRADVLPLVVESDVGAKIRVLYGGSIDRENAKQLFALADIDGGLVGGASLDGETFRFLCKIASET